MLSDTNMRRAAGWVKQVWFDAFIAECRFMRYFQFHGGKRRLQGDTYFFGELFPDAAARSTRPAVIAAITGGDVVEELNKVQFAEVSADREYWMPLRHDLELLSHAARREPPQA
ncbi:MAG: hypothetical protein ABJB66_00565 [Gemmatimonadaceae bacterium]